MNPSAEYIRERFAYDPASGVLSWRAIDAGNDPKKRTWNTRYADKPAGGVTTFGYLKLKLGDRHYQVHRLVWLWNAGEWPSHFIDHIDHDRQNNRIENLRLVTHIQNCRNAVLPKSNTSGACGVRWRAREKKWHAYIYVDRKTLHLGFFPERENAVAARKSAERQHGFHENHGAAS